MSTNEDRRETGPRGACPVLESPVRHSRQICGIASYILVGCVIGALISSVGGHTFGLHVRSFYPPGTDYSFLMNLTSRLAEGIRPLAWFGATFGGVYYCYRHQMTIVYVLSGGIAGYVIGFLVSGHVTADPGPNYHTSVYDVPAGYLTGTIVAVMLQTLRNDWSVVS